MSLSSLVLRILPLAFVSLSAFAQEYAIVDDQSQHGQIVFHTGAQLHGIKRPVGADLPVIARPEEGYRLESLQVLTTTGSQTRTASYPASKFYRGLFQVPGSCLEGNVVLQGTFVPLTDDEEPEALSWKLTFYDEFNLSDGSQPNGKKWGRSKRSSATWNRFVSESTKVVYLEGGNLVTRCIPDPDRSQGSTDMISGAIQSKGKYSFKYGRVECRLRTTKHTGNFPALWMMPENTADGWPTCGEIDIFETIDSQDRAWHTVHSHWTYDLGKTQSPTSSANEWLDVDSWHVYAFEWDSEEMRWYVDGRLVHTYHKSSDANALAQGQWPFDKEFYLILNQSVGNGSWAAKQDANFTYETLFDYIRVYQLAPTQFIPTGIEQIDNPQMTPRNQIYDLSGRLVQNPHSRLYIKQGRKYFVR